VTAAAELRCHVPEHAGRLVVSVIGVEKSPVHTGHAVVPSGALVTVVVACTQPLHIMAEQPAGVYVVVKSIMPLAHCVALVPCNSGGQWQVGDAGGVAAGVAAGACVGGHVPQQFPGDVDVLVLGLTHVERATVLAGH